MSQKTRNARERSKATEKNPAGLAAARGPPALAGHQGEDEAATAPSCPVVGIGASAGGVEAFSLLFKHLPPDSGMAFVIIQHLDPTHASFLRDVLARTTPMPVSEAAQDMRLEPNHVYVIPPNSDLRIHGCRLELVPRRSEGRKLHLPIDAFFRSLAEELGSGAIGVVLSGTASDGTEGLRAIKAADGITFAQEPGSARFGGMPESAFRAGVVDYCLPIPELAEELVRLSRHSYVSARPGPATPSDEGAFKEILALVRRDFRVDLSEYKSATVMRRLARRMAVRHVEDLAAYGKLLRDDPAEIRALYEDSLIHVTSFFRDPTVFESLRDRVFPEIIEHKPQGAPIRIWVAGCSTGEEVYSVAIALLEWLGERGHRYPIQIFGSDISEKAIERARAGVFADSALADVSDDRRRRYFTKLEHGYRINKMVRDLCVFVRHDLARDPPFSKLDLISCRNVLIYFEQELQSRVIPTFHYALHQPGFLLLGRSESVSAFGALFSPLDKTNRVFARTALVSQLRFAPRTEVHAGPGPLVHTALAGTARHVPDVSRHLDRLLLARYSPPGVVVNDKFEIVEFRGQTGAYLQPPPGEPQLNLLLMARGGGLVAALRSAIRKASQEMCSVRKEGIEVRSDGHTGVCDVVVVPLHGLPGATEQLFVVLFEGRPAPEISQAKVKKPRAPAAVEPAEQRRSTMLEDELAATKEYLQTLVEEHGEAIDELGAANEELVSGNEELQSMNEELETAKEELQSTNEELITVNDELHDRNHELSVVNGDLVNLLGAVDIAILILDMGRRIRRFTPKAQTVLNVLPSDVGRPLDDIKPNVEVADLDREISTVIETLTMTESEVQDREGRWYRMQIRPYKTLDNRIDGAILSLVDINALRIHIDEAQQAKADAERANRAKDQFLATLGHELRTPLSSVYLQAQLLQRGHLDEAKVKRAAGVIERGAKMQVQLIDDLLDISRIAAGKFKLEVQPIDLVGVVGAALEGVSSLAEQKQVTLERAAPSGTTAMLSGDATRLQQAISNLLTNAIKFTPSGGRVKAALEINGLQACLAVSDTGMGIDPEFLPHVFNRFTQEDSSNTRRYGGLGLGLSIVRHIVEFHGGSVRAESPGPGKGATFRITLPLLATRQSGRTPLRALPGAAGPLPLSLLSSARLQLDGVRVLVIEDDAGTREVVAEMLKEAGAAVRTSDSALAAMPIVDEFGPHVLLCDIAMPGEDGYSFIRRLRARDRTRGGNTPALALTALAGEDDVRRALTAGYQMHLAKPVDLDRLTDAVAELSQKTPLLVHPPTA